MLNFELSEDQQAFRELCRDFAKREIEPLAKAADDEAEFPVGLLKRAAGAGLLGLAAPVELGGGGAGAVEEVIFAEECAKVDPNLAVALIVEGCLAPSLLWNFGTEEQRQAYVVPVLAGEKVLALAVTEPNAGSDVAAAKTAAVRADADTWVLSGEKCFISLATYASHLVVLAQTDPTQGIDGMRFFVVDTSSPGVEITKMDMWANRGAPTTQVFLHDVEVPEGNRIDAGFRSVMEMFNKERILVAARWLGHAQHAFEWALSYATTREQFGKRIGDFQSVAFQLADAKVDIESARWLVYHAAWKWDQGVPVKDLVMDASACKLHATQMVHRVTQLALHIGGGWALVKDELPAAQMAIDAFIAPVTVGSWEIQKRIIARQLGLRTE